MASGSKDPFSGMVHKQPTPQCLERIRRDLAEFQREPAPGVFVAPEDGDLTRIHAILMGPPGTPFEGGFFHVMMKCPSNYPMEPPLVRFMTTGGGKVFFSPHIYSDGSLCLSLLGTSQVGQSWSAAQTICSLLVSIQSLLDDNIFSSGNVLDYVVFGYLGPSHSANMKYQTIRVAVCGTVEECMRGDTLIPVPLREQVIKTFHDNYTKYERAAENEQGFLSRYWFGNSKEKLLEQLRKLKEDITEMEHTAAKRRRVE